MPLDNNLPKEIRDAFDVEGTNKKLDHILELSKFQKEQIMIGTNAMNNLEDKYVKLIEYRKEREGVLRKAIDRYEQLRNERRSLQKQGREMRAKMDNDSGLGSSTGFGNHVAQHGFIYSPINTTGMSHGNQSDKTSDNGSFFDFKLDTTLDSGDFFGYEAEKSSSLFNFGHEPSTKRSQETSRASQSSVQPPLKRNTGGEGLPGGSSDGSLDFLSQRSSTPRSAYFKTGPKPSGSNGNIK